MARKADWEDNVEFMKIAKAAWPDDFEVVQTLEPYDKVREQARSKMARRYEMFQVLDVLDGRIDGLAKEVDEVKEAIDVLRLRRDGGV